MLNNIVDISCYIIAYIFAILRLILWGVVLVLILWGIDALTDKYFHSQNVRFWKWLKNLSIFK